MSSLARWCFRRRFTVLGLWIAALIVLAGLGAAAGSRYTDQFSLPGTESTRALDLLQKSFPAQSGDSDQIVWHLRGGTVDGAAAKARV
jgi:RND superfamily putative drug exporter